MDVFTTAAIIDPTHLKLKYPSLHTQSSTSPLLILGTWELAGQGTHELLPCM